MKRLLSLIFTIGVCLMSLTGEVEARRGNLWRNRRGPGGPVVHRHVRRAGRIAKVCLEGTILAASAFEVVKNFGKACPPESSAIRRYEFNGRELATSAEGAFLGTAAAFLAYKSGRAFWRDLGRI